MKKNFRYFIVCALACFGLMFGACQKEENNNNNNNDPCSIIGTWKMNHATQITPWNESDATPLYGDNFQLIFKEGGILITTNGVHEAEMQYVLDGTSLDFIQVAGADPVHYTITTLDAKKLVIENGTADECLTIMDFDRIN